MVIRTQTDTDRHVLQLEGRLDANWAEHVAKAMEASIRAGHHELELDFAEVSYISSAGIRVLLKYYRQLKGVGGFLRVLRPTDTVLSVLRLSGLAPLLMAGPSGTTTPAAPVPASTGPEETSPRRWQNGGAEFESFQLAAEAQMRAELFGSPEAFAKGELSAAKTRRVRCTPDLIAVGLGAFGLRPEELEGRFGESLVLAGSAVTQPTDGSSVPDYQLTERDLVPELELLYGLTARGQFSRLIRFEGSRSERGVISLGSLVEAILAHLQAPALGLAILAESASIIGAGLKRSPALAAGKPVLAFPGVRDWLSFTTERSDERNLVLISGFAARTPGREAALFLRPIGPGTQAYGHFHAAVFPYRPLAKGRLELNEAVASMLSTESAQAVLHLMADEREFEGVGQTDFMRGACWASPARFGGDVPEPQANL